MMALSCDLLGGKFSDSVTTWCLNCSKDRQGLQRNPCCGPDVFLQNKYTWELNFGAVDHLYLFSFINLLEFLNATLNMV